MALYGGISEPQKITPIQATEQAKHFEQLQEW